MQRHKSRRHPWRTLNAFATYVSGPFSLEILHQRAATGWQMVSIEWRRELPDSESPSDGAFAKDIPYGLRISEDGLRLEVDPTENRALMLMMDLLGQDFSYSAIVSDLNEKGFRTRSDRPWTRVAVFNMMPRLIEAARASSPPKNGRPCNRRVSKAASQKTGPRA
jgi:hypothetical protein